MVRLLLKHGADAKQPGPPATSSRVLDSAVLSLRCVSVQQVLHCIL